MKNFDPDRPQLTLAGEAPAELLQILLLDRDATEAFALRRAFEACPTARLAYTADVATAVRLLASQHWDLVVADPALPRDIIRAPSRQVGTFHALGGLDFGKTLSTTPGRFCLRRRIGQRRTGYCD